MEHHALDSRQRRVYHRARELAINNERQYHVAAILRRKGRVVRIGENTSKTHPRFKRQYKDGTWGSHMHAEMNVLRFSQPGDTLEVMRFTKKGMAMAKPCVHCMQHIVQSGITKVSYTDENGQWKHMHIKRSTK